MIPRCIFTFLVLEATDAENLLEQFEDASDQTPQNIDDKKNSNNENSDNSKRTKETLTFNTSSQDPYKKSQIIAAVQSHFSISSSNEVTSDPIKTNSVGKKPPRIGKYNILYNPIGT